MKNEREQAKNLICDIIEMEGGNIAGLTRLYKAFYYAHLYYWECGTGVLTSYPVVRMPRGPAIDDGPALLNELKGEGAIHMSVQMNGPYKENVISLSVRRHCDPSSDRYKAIKAAIEQVKGKTASQLSEETHAYSRSWQSGKDGQELDIYVDLMDDMEFQKMQEDRKQAEDAVHAAFQS